MRYQRFPVIIEDVPVMHGTIISFEQSIKRPPSQYTSLAEKELFDVDTGQVIPEIVLMRSEEIRTMVSMGISTITILSLLQRWTRPSTKKTRPTWL